MKKLLFCVFVGIVIGNAECGRRPRDLKTGRHVQKEKMLHTNKIPKARINELETENEVAVEPVSRFLDPCEDCKSLVTKIDAVLKDHAKLEELKTMLNLACDTLPSKYRNECKEVVENLDTLAEEIEPLLRNPLEFCREIHLCGSGRVSRVLQFFMLFLKKYVYQIHEPRSGGSLLCDECVMVMSEAKTLLSDKQIQDELKSELKAICNMLGSVKEECDSLVDQFFPTLIAELEQLLSNPREICKELGLCDSIRMAIRGFPLTQSRQGRLTPNVGMNRFRFLISRLHTKNGMNVPCVMCKFSIQTLVDAMKDDDSILNGIANTMKEVCNIMPQQGIRPSCEDFMTVYSKPVILLTLNEINSRQLCQDFHLCSDHELGEIRRNGENMRWKNEVVCDACKTLADFLKFECRQRSFQEALANEAKHFCDLIPGGFAAQCDNMMDQYVPYLIQLLTSELDPNTVCPELHLCQTPRSSQQLQEISDE